MWGMWTTWGMCIIEKSEADSKKNEIISVVFSTDKSLDRILDIIYTCFFFTFINDVYDDSNQLF